MSPLTESQTESIVRKAVAVRSKAYAPYSNFCVGAAVLLDDGATVVVGCNVENASYGLSICAERSAICQAVALGGRDVRIVAIAVAAVPMATPCGACRQFIAEFGENIRLICVNADDPQLRQQYSASELLPHGFSKTILKR